MKLHLYVHAVFLTLGVASCKIRKNSESKPLDDDQLELYSVRPDILSIEPEAFNSKDHSAQENTYWTTEVKLAHLQAATFLTGFYSTHEIYFLARDAELLYDITRALASKEDRKRIHLINVSRQHIYSNDGDPNLLSYLDQEGISPAKIADLSAKGRRYLFVDTGFSGTIPHALFKAIPQLQHHTDIHLLASENRYIPSVRSFLRGISAGFDPLSVSSVKMSHRALIELYEHMPRFTYKSTFYTQQDGRFVPSSYKAKHLPKDRVDRNFAREVMADIRFFAEKKEIQKFWENRIELILTIRKLTLDYKNAEKNLVFLIDELQVLRTRIGESEFLPFLVDFIEVAKGKLRVNCGPILSALKIQLSVEKNPDFSSDLYAVTEVKNDLEIEDFSQSEKIAFIQKYPELSSLVMDPDIGVLNAIKENKLNDIKFVLENLKNNEFSSNIADYLESTSLEPNLESQQFIEYLLTFNKKLFLASAAHQYSTSFKDEKLITQLFSTAVTAKRYDVMKTLIDSDFQSPKELFANLITKEPTADLNFFPRE